MKNSFNKVILRGFIGKSPDVKHFQDNIMLAKASLATSEGYRTSDREWKTETMWHNLVFWGKWASFAELNLRSGSYVEVQGKLNYRSFQDEHGNSRYVTEIIVDTAKEVARDQ